MICRLVASLVLGCFGMHDMPLYEQVLAHANAEYPREACGVLVRVRPSGELVYVPCANVAPQGAQQDAFEISPRDWSTAEDLGVVEAVVHSHPDASAAASDSDRRACGRSKLAWYIVAVPGGAWQRIEPAALPLVGREFCHGKVDCYTLIQDYYEQTLGIQLPDHARVDEWWMHGQNLYLDHFEAAGFVSVGNGVTADIKEHDGLLMRVASPVSNHGGVYIGDQAMLHHLYGRLSERTVWGGYWQRHCTHVLRHRSRL